MRFEELGLEEKVLQGLEAMNFQETTPIQEKTIPVIMSGRDIIGCAQTGTGKTAAYILPLLNRMVTEPEDNGHIKAIVMAPTRELAQQIDRQFEGFSYFVPISTIAVYGGGDGNVYDRQKQGMLSGVDVIIATPGRFITQVEMYNIDLSHIRYFILDEADRMLDMGFSDDIMRIAKKLPENRQTILFSATMPPKIQQLAKSILHDPEEVKIAVSKPNEAITQAAYVCTEMQKMGLIKEIFGKPVKSKSLIFSSSKQTVKELAYTLKRMKFNVMAMHSDLDQAEREKVMLDFKNNKITILVATDIVARGIDIEDIGMVLNYDVPHDPEDYIHRIGRTARANAEGLAITFVSEREQGKFQRIERFLEKEIYKIPMPPELGKAPVYDPAAHRDEDGRFRHGHGGQGGRGSENRHGRDGHGDRRGNGDNGGKRRFFRPRKSGQGSRPSVS